MGNWYSRLGRKYYDGPPPTSPPTAQVPPDQVRRRTGADGTRSGAPAIGASYASSASSSAFWAWSRFSA